MADENDQSAVIAFLSNPASHGVPGPVARIDTSAAVIFLAGERAIKLKRAVRYPYLDFSGAAQRKAVCEAELALNRRTAPDLYLGVEPVGRLGDGTLALGRGDPVDWVVVMRRFPADCLFDAMARSHRLTGPLLRDLADGIAAFHDGAAIVAGPGAQRVRQVIEGNRASMEALPPGLLPAADCAELQTRSLAALAELAPLLDSRAADGHVRYCHGDLHLANICLWNGRPTLFDCLEFDPELATSDVLYDLAFLLMDLCRRGLHAEASLLFNRYCDMQGESEGLAALPLFLSMRAAVRAHVNASASRRQNDAGPREAALAEARAYLRAALGFLTSPPPRLIAIGGLSGSGKSTLAAALAPLVGAAPGARWLRTDVLRKRLAGVAPEEHLPPEAYTRERSAAVYARLQRDAEATLAAGRAVIVDGVFADPREREAMRELAARAGVAFTGLWLDAPREVLMARVAARAADAASRDASDADGAVVERQLAYALGDLGGWVALPAAGSPQQLVAAALERVSSPDGGPGRT